MEKRGERKAPSRRDGGEREEQKPNPEVTAKGEKLKKDIDKLVEEIDDTLEKNAEEFVKNYVQKGGE